MLYYSQLKLLIVTLVFAPIFCEALLENAFDSDVDLLAEETDLSAAHIRAPRTAGYFYAHAHSPAFYSPSGPKGFFPPPRFGNQYGGYGGHDGYGGYGGYGGNPYDSDENDYDDEVPRPHSHHHHHHHHHRQGPPNRGFPNIPFNRGPLQSPNAFIASNNGRPTVMAPSQEPSQLANPFLPLNNGRPIQVPNTNNAGPIQAPPSQAPAVANPRPVVNPRPVINPTPIPMDPLIQVVATPPTSTSAPTDEGDPYNIDIRFGN